MDSRRRARPELGPDSGTGDDGRVLPGPHNETEALKVQGDALQAVYLGKAKAKDIFKDVATQVNDLIKLS